MNKIINFLFPYAPNIAATTVSVEEQIHRDVYSAQDLLLAEANRILNEPITWDAEKEKIYKELHGLGFGNSEQVRAYTELKRQRDEQDRLKKKIEYYSLHYPNNKFINEKAVKTICEKYGLLLADAHDYISDIPEKNQKEIIAFRVNSLDVEERFGGRFAGLDFGSTLRESWMQAMLRVPTIKVRDDGNIEFVEEPVPAKPAQKKEMRSGQGLKIVAPVHKLNTSGKKKNKYRLEQEIKDPIVLQPVKDGYLIVSSWGLEASDPIVVNPKHN